MRNCDLLVRASVIVTQNSRRDILKDSAFAVCDGRIVEIGPADSLLARLLPDRFLDLGGCMILPGLINAHAHASMTFLRGLADDMPVLDWLTRKIFPAERDLSPHICRTGALLGFAEMIRAGATACLDMYIFEDAVLDAAETAGIRCHGGEAVFDFPSAACAGWRDALDATRRLAERCAGNPRLGAVVSPHSMYTTSDESLEACRDLAEELDLPVHIHLAESAGETARCMELHGMRPLERADRFGLLSGRAAGAHLVDLLPEEIDLLARRGACAIHCPSSNMKLASGVSPVPAMLAAGVPAALGTDGAASNNRLNMFTEMGRAALLHKLDSGDAAALPAQAVLDMATLGGARVLHDPALGTLEIGMSADFVALDLDAPNMRPMYNPVSHAVYAATGAETRAVVVAGEAIWCDGSFARFDYDDLLKEIEDIAATVARKNA